MCLTYFVSGVSGNGGIDRVERDADLTVLPWVDMDPLRPAHWRARRAGPVLAFAMIRRQLDRVSVAAVVGLVRVEHGLHPVVAGRYVGEALLRIPEDARIEHTGLAALSPWTSIPNICWCRRDPTSRFGARRCYPSR